MSEFCAVPAPDSSAPLVNWLSWDGGDCSHRKKRMRQLQKKIKNGTLNLKQDDPFELFVAATNIRYCYYNETHKILGNTFGMCVLQVGDTLLPGTGGRSWRRCLGGRAPLRTGTQ